jgi:glutathione S-transferase
MPEEPFLKLLCEFENANGTIAGLLESEQAAIMERIAEIATHLSPRQSAERQRAHADTLQAKLERAQSAVREANETTWDSMNVHQTQVAWRKRNAQAIKAAMGEGK